MSKIFEYFRFLYMKYQYMIYDREKTRPQDFK